MFFYSLERIIRGCVSIFARYLVRGWFRVWRWIQDTTGLKGLPFYQGQFFKTQGAFRVPKHETIHSKLPGYFCRQHTGSPQVGFFRVKQVHGEVHKQEQPLCGNFQCWLYLVVSGQCCGPLDSSKLENLFFLPQIIQGHALRESRLSFGRRSNIYI